MVEDIKEFIENYLVKGGLASSETEFIGMSLCFDMNMTEADISELASAIGSEYGVDVSDEVRYNDTTHTLAERVNNLL